MCATREAEIVLDLMFLMMDEPRMMEFGVFFSAVNTQVRKTVCIVYVLFVFTHTTLTPNVCPGHGEGCIDSVLR